MSADAATGGGWRRVLRTTFYHRCPACGIGPLFARGYTLHRRCSACGLDLEGEHGAHYGGPIILGYATGGIVGLALFALLFRLFGYATWLLWATVAAVIGTIALTFRHCKAFWTWYLYATGELAPDREPSGGDRAS